MPAWVASLRPPLQAVAVPSLPRTRVPHLWGMVLIKTKGTYLFRLPVTPSVTSVPAFRKICDLVLGSPGIVSVLSGKYSFLLYFLRLAQNFHSRDQIVVLFFSN